MSHSSVYENDGILYFWKYGDIQHSSIHSISYNGTRSGWPRIINDPDQRHLLRIVCTNKQATLAHISSAFYAGQVGIL